VSEFKCPECGESFPSNRLLAWHTARVHPYSNEVQENSNSQLQPSESRRVTPTIWEFTKGVVFILVGIAIIIALIWMVNIGKNISIFALIIVLVVCLSFSIVFFIGGIASIRVTIKEFTFDINKPNSQRKTFVIDGNNFSDLNGFWDEVQNVLTDDFEGFGRNGDALIDLLRGGFGKFGANEYLTIIWKHSRKSRRELGTSTYNEIVEIMREPKNIILVLW
jgi:RNAse (barnase) inhibitor barstar